VTQAQGPIPERLIADSLPAALTVPGSLAESLDVQVTGAIERPYDAPCIRRGAAGSFVAGMRLG
jgi:hypothetical protein